MMEFSFLGELTLTNSHPGQLEAAGWSWSTAYFSTWDCHH